MKMYKNIVLLLLLSILLIGLNGCSNTNTNNINDNINKFPLDENGYPKTDKIIFNGEIYDIKDLFSEEKIEEEIYVEANNDEYEYEIILPVGVNNLTWDINRRNITLNTYKKIDLAVKEELDGPSTSLQLFVFTTDLRMFELKNHNIEEIEKPFLDKEYNYFLNIYLN